MTKMTMSHPNPERDERVTKLNERCEWNPVLRVASSDPPRDTDCRNETWWSIGHGERNFHVCNSCAKLPEFQLRKKRDPINANPVSIAKERDEWKSFAEECKEGIRASHRVLDELGIPREDAWLQETDGENYGIEEVVEYPVHERIKILPPLAATRMRDRCLEKVREMRSGWEKELQYEEDFDWRVDTATKIITALQSLTLEGEQGENETIL